MKKFENAMLNRRQALALGVSGAASLALAACGGGSSDGGATAADEAVEATVTVWGPQEDQSDDNGNWLKTECEAFAAEHPDWTLTFKYGVCSEGDAKTNIGTDPSAGADVYLYANDQIPDLLKAGGIAEFGGSTLDAIKWYTLRMAWATLPLTLARFLMLTLVFMYFRYYQQYFTRLTVIGRSLQYIGRRTLDIYLIHFLFMPDLPHVGEFFKAHPHNFTIDVTLSVLFALLIIGFSIITSNILRISPFFKKWLFGRS
jgi:hypothetical protein